jgi:hypothetical protein
MILIRGIKGEQYARKIKKGIVDCRDVLSTLLEPPVTGYEFSDYYEKNFVKAAAALYGKEADIHEPEFLYDLMIHYVVPHMYLTYFHILNPKSLEWLDSFEDGDSFIVIDVQLDQLTQTAIGHEYFGAQMAYVDTICELEQNGYNPFQAACMVSIEDLFEDKTQMIPWLRLYNTLAFALLCREKDDKFTDIENEFRIIAYDCPRIVNGRIQQAPRPAVLTGQTGMKYKGVLTAGMDSMFESNTFVFRDLKKSLREIIAEEKGMVTLDSQFKSIDIRDISDNYRFIGGKEQCAEFIKKSLASMPQERCVNKTIQRTYRREDIPDAMFTKSHRDVEY